MSCTAPFGLRPSAMPAPPGKSTTQRAIDGMKVTSSGRRTSRAAPANSAPPTAPMPPTTVRAKIWRLLTRSKLLGVIDDELHRVERAAEPGDAGRDREHRELGAEQVQAERRARGLAVLHREQAPAEPTAPDRDDDQRDERERRPPRAPSATPGSSNCCPKSSSGVDVDRPGLEEVHVEQAEHRRSSGRVKTHRSRVTANAAVPSAR